MNQLVEADGPRAKPGRRETFVYLDVLIGGFHRPEYGSGSGVQLEPVADLGRVLMRRGKLKDLAIVSARDVIFEQRLGIEIAEREQDAHVVEGNAPRAG